MSTGDSDFWNLLTDMFEGVGAPRELVPFKLCEECGKYPVIPPKKKYCSRACSQRSADKKPRKRDQATVPPACVVCGNLPVQYPYRIVCSKECADERKQVMAWNSSRSRYRRRAAASKPKPVCAHCGKKPSVEPYRIVCSKECSEARKKARNKAYRADPVNKKKALEAQRAWREALHQDPERHEQHKANMREHDRRKRYDPATRAGYLKKKRQYQADRKYKDKLVSLISFTSKGEQDQCSE